MIRRYRWQVLLGASLFLLSACGLQNGLSSSNSGTTGDFLHSEAERITDPQVSQEALSTQVEANTDFALEVLRRLGDDPDENVFFSPHSIEVALAMTWAGARGQTEKDMARAMRFVLEGEQVHRVFNYLDLALASRGDQSLPAGEGQMGFVLRSVQALWSQVGFPVNDAFLDLLAGHYGAGLGQLDFQGNPEGATGHINDWVADQTAGNIPELIPPGTINPMTTLVLVNAVHFCAAWAVPFAEELTRQASFVTASGQAVAVSMMHKTTRFPRVVTPGYRAVRLPYQGEQLAMLIVAPEPGNLAEFERNLDADFLASLEQQMEMGEVRLSMPRWRLDGQTVSLKELLGSMGMQVAFTSRANFSGISGEAPLHIQDVLHQALIEVDEKGTEASAATAVLVGKTGISQSPEIVLDHPFYYFIQDLPTGQILFMGRMSNPAQAS